MAEPYIIAIDFGTTYSGYAYSLTSRQADVDPHVHLWGSEVSLRTSKAPTCILFNDHEEFVSFGYKAQKAYLKMRGEEARSFFFFENFKMSLYGTKPNRDLNIKAVNGKSMNALKVFTEALRFIKDDALKTIAENTEGKKFIASDFTWVLTVPAIWDHSAKHFMREAASSAGFTNTGEEFKFVIALEPEAASVWCRKLPADGFISDNHGKVCLDESLGTQYIVVDCGGGTIDITVHEVLHGGALKELHKASGHDMGGETVNREFKRFLNEIFGDVVWGKYIKNYPGELQEILYDFTILKENDEAVDISCPYNLSEQVREEGGRDMADYFGTVRSASWKDGCIELSREKMRSFFDASLKGITKSLREILSKDFRIEYIVLVGGYSQSKILRQHIRSQFDGQCRVLCPLGPQEAVMKGAVMFGRNPAAVASRKSAFTYGVDVDVPFDASKHEAKRKIQTDVGEKCCIFWKLVDVEADVKWNETKDLRFSPAQFKQKSMSFTFYRTERKDPLYVDEWGVEKLGSFAVSMPDTTRDLNRNVILKITFGFTEIKATATDEDSGSTESIELDFMTTT
ncbi:heat shock 70 kDa protein 12A-like [Embiotoca jacksoni]|uniref:heat shock 70 kDa protein 12A-like n=1 Tax=Embiotoca jacksoni TaxID=100190 RepID=UPI003703B994